MLVLDLILVGSNRAIGLTESIAPKFQQNPQVSMSKADMIALAGLVSITHCGGPSMKFRAGRVDAKPGHYTPPHNRIPDPKVSLVDFKKRAAEMGWTNEDVRMV